MPCFVVGSHKLCHKYGVLAPDMLLVNKDLKLVLRSLRRQWAPGTRRG